MAIKLPKIRINPHRIADLALDAVRESEALGGPGEEKFERARQCLVEKLDELITFGPGPVGRVAEAVSDVAIRALVGGFVEWAWAELFGPGEAEAA